VGNTKRFIIAGAPLAAAVLHSYGKLTVTKYNYKPARGDEVMVGEE